MQGLENSISSDKPVKLRVVISKGENVKYISHLDLLRTITRAFRRSGFPVKYSEGFNPHPQITFALPLALGATADNEIFDVLTTGQIDVSGEIERLSRVLPNGIVIKSAALTQSPMPVAVAAEYTVTLDTEEEGAENMLRLVREGELYVEKRTKRGSQSINVAEHIKKLEILSKKPLIFKIILPAGNTFNIKPELFLEALSVKLPAFRDVHFEINRDIVHFE